MLYADLLSLHLVTFFILVQELGIVVVIYFHTTIGLGDNDSIATTCATVLIELLPSNCNHQKKQSV